MRTATPTTAHDSVRDLFIDLGELEGGLADALSPTCETAGPIERLARAAMTAAGQWFAASWQHVSVSPRQLQFLYHALSRLAEMALPDEITVSIPKGYAYYAVYPEAYFEAARTFSSTCGSSQASVIGLRSIGTSLSAAVVAGLAAGGISAESWTVRPRGNPFHRRLVVADALLDQWRQHRDTWWFVVDDGPGISGSNMAGAVELLEHLGIPNERVVIVAQGPPDPAHLTPHAAPVWRRHPWMTAPLERGGPLEGFLRARVGASDVEDWSGGAWRPHLFDEPSRFPAIHPAHERLKWRVETARGPCLVKFAGLGRAGHAVCRRYRAAADAGFGPAVIALRDGLLSLALIEGRPLTRDDGAADHVDRIADYLAWMARTTATTQAVDVASVIQMVATNVEEALGGDVAGRVSESAGRDRPVLEDRPVQVVDGHVFPHEWLWTGERLVKTDNGEHGDDHFFPGPLDVAWDVAAVLSEFEWPHGARRRLVERYAATARDATIERRLPFYRLAYLAFRTAYTATAAASLAHTDEAPRLMTTSEQYLHGLMIAARQYGTRKRVRRT